jgi:hypothetical protein
MSTQNYITMEQSTLRIIDNIRKVATQMDAILQRDLLDAASRLQEQAELIEKMRAEMVNPDDLSGQMLKLVAGMNEAKAAQVRPEPSRLEIAAMILASSCSHPDRDCGGGTIWALEYADALIEAAK